MKNSYYLLPLLVLLAAPSLRAAAAGASTGSCKAWLVQSIPTDMPLLATVPGVLRTGDVLRWMAGNATRRLDVIAQYWQLLSQPENPRSGDYGYSASDMERFGSGEGRAVYKALEAAAERTVDIRFLQNSGVYPDYTQEPTDLASGKPNVQSVTLLLGDWWGSGIVHAKVWISDSKDIYIGSANNDWKSLTQVKEVGIYLVGCPKIAKRLGIYFDNLWKLSSLNATAYTRIAWDETWQASQKFPCWSHFIPHRNRCSCYLIKCNQTNKHGSRQSSPCDLAESCESIRWTGSVSPLTRNRRYTGLLFHQQYPRCSSNFLKTNAKYELEQQEAFLLQFLNDVSSKMLAQSSKQQGNNKIQITRGLRRQNRPPNHMVPGDERCSVISQHHFRRTGKNS